MTTDSKSASECITALAIGHIIELESGQVVQIINGVLVVSFPPNICRGQHLTKIDFRGASIK